MKKVKLLVLTLIFTMVLGNMSVFAAITGEEPENPNDPIVRMAIQKDETGKYTKMTFKNEKISSCKIDFEGILYDTSKSYDLRQPFEPEGGWAFANNSLYKLKLISSETPVFATDPSTHETVSDGQYGYNFELIPTTEIPSRNTFIKTIKSNVYSEAENVTHEYYVNSNRVTVDVYNKSKKGTYSEKTESKYTYGAPTLTNTKTVFKGMTEESAVRHWSDGVDETYIRPRYNYEITETYTIDRNVLKIHNLAVQNSSEVVETSDPEKTENVEKVETVTLNVKMRLARPKAGKKAAIVKWSKLSKKNRKKIKGYEIQYSVNKDFSDAKTVRAGRNARAKKLTRLARRTTYYVRARAVSGEKIGPWSTVRRVKTR